MKKWSEYFVTKKVGEKEIVVLHEEPECLKELISKIHKYLDSEPNDWICTEILEAFEEIEKHGFDGVLMSANIWPKDLIKWLQEPFAYHTCDEYMKHFVLGHFESLVDIIANGQWYVRKYIYSQVDKFIESKKEESGE